MQNSPRTNPCYKEQEITYKCFNENNFDKSACELEIFNYRNCTEFWYTVKKERKRKGITPLLPPEEEREAIKQEFLSKLSHQKN